MHGLIPFPALPFPALSVHTADCLFTLLRRCCTPLADAVGAASDQACAVDAAGPWRLSNDAVHKGSKQAHYGKIKYTCVALSCFRLFRPTTYKYAERCTLMNIIEHIKIPSCIRSKLRQTEPTTALVYKIAVTSGSDRLGCSQPARLPPRMLP